MKRMVKCTETGVLILRNFGFKFIIISDIYDDITSENGTNVKSLLPPISLVSKFINNEISEFEFRAEYHVHLLQDIYMSSLFAIVLGVIEKNKRIAIVTSSEENENFFVLDIISKIIEDGYGIEVIDMNEFMKEYNYNISAFDKGYIDHLSRDRVKDSLSAFGPVMKESFDTTYTSLSMDELKKECKRLDIFEKLKKKYDCKFKDIPREKIIKALMKERE